MNNATVVRWRIGAAAAAAVALLFCIPASGAHAEETTKSLVIGYLELADDPRYLDDRAYARIQLRPLGRPFAGAQVALEEAEMVGRVIGVDFAIERVQGEDAGDLMTAIDRLQAEGIAFFLIDAPGGVVADVAEEATGRELLLFNVSSSDDALRRERCQAHLVHAIPSRAMQMDALVQYLASKRWTDLLVLEGPLPEDAAMAESLERSASRFGARILETKPFRLTNDPREREQSNVALMTSGGDYDAVVVIDSDGEFGRYVPYQTNHPRPVVGSTGLVPDTWHWAWERHGAPQLNERFEDAAGRRMTGQDWAAWAAVRAIVQSALRTRSTAFAELARFLKSDEMNLDGFKGPALSFRSWDNQLRQPILLSTHNAVIARAPLEGFLHPQNDLDTLGDDAAETECHF